MLFRDAQWCCRFQSRHVVAPRARKSSPCTLETPQNRRFYACWENFFAEVPVEGLCWASLFAPVGSAPRSCRRRGARGWLRWGFCSIRSWLAACRRRVVALMTPFPPFGDGSARPPPFAPAAPGVRARSASLARPRPCVLRPERIGLISRNLVLHSRVASAKIVVSTPTWRVIRPPVR